jgi:hypothetical protein
MATHKTDITTSITKTSDVFMGMLVLYTGGFYNLLAQGKKITFALGLM